MPAEKPNIEIGGYAASREWLLTSVQGEGKHCTVRFVSGDVMVTIRNVEGPWLLNVRYSTLDVASLIDGVWRREDSEARGK